jgi:hypothetical protein
MYRIFKEIYRLTYSSQLCVAIIIEYILSINDFMEKELISTVYRNARSNIS